MEGVEFVFFFGGVWVSEVVVLSFPDDICDLKYCIVIDVWFHVKKCVFCATTYFMCVF